MGNLLFISSNSILESFFLFDNDNIFIQIKYASLILFHALIASMELLNSCVSTFSIEYCCSKEIEIFLRKRQTFIRSQLLKKINSVFIISQLFRKKLLSVLFLEYCYFLFHRLGLGALQCIMSSCTCTMFYDQLVFHERSQYFFNQWQP